MLALEQLNGPSIQRKWCNTSRTLRRVLVKEPRYSEASSVRNCYIYRSTRLCRLFSAWTKIHTCMRTPNTVHISRVKRKSSAAYLYMGYTSVNCERSSGTRWHGAPLDRREPCFHCRQIEQFDRTTRCLKACRRQCNSHTGMSNRPPRRSRRALFCGCSYHASGDLLLGWNATALQRKVALLEVPHARGESTILRFVEKQHTRSNVITNLILSKICIFHVRRCIWNPANHPPGRLALGSVVISDGLGVWHLFLVVFKFLATWNTKARQRKWAIPSVQHDDDGFIERLIPLKLSVECSALDQKIRALRRCLDKNPWPNLLFNRLGFGVSSTPGYFEMSISDFESHPWRPLLRLGRKSRKWCRVYKCVSNMSMVILLRDQDIPSYYFDKPKWFPQFSQSNCKTSGDRGATVLSTLQHTAGFSLIRPIRGLMSQIE